MPVVSLLYLTPFPSGANNDMNATFMSLLRHECGIYVVGERGGEGKAVFRARRCVPANPQ